MNLKDIKTYLTMPKVNQPKQEEKCSCGKRDLYKCANESDNRYGNMCLKEMK